MVAVSMLPEVRRRVDQKVADFGAPGTVTIALRYPRHVLRARGEYLCVGDA